MDTADLARVTRAYGDAVRLAKDTGFDAVELHAGHGYLLSQFLSPRTNHRTDAYGGPLEHRLRFVREVMAEARRAASGMALLVKMNLRDGFPGGMELEEAVQVARALEEAGADALVLSGGFVSRAPMYLMRGDSIAGELGRRMRPWWLRLFVRAFGAWLIPAVPYEDHYFLEDASVVRGEVRLPLVYVGGVTTRASADAVLARGFDAIALARALIREPDFVNRLKREEGDDESRCDHCNTCAGRIYTTSMGCHHLIGRDAP
jgi:2,4-dienoyl-CoA reductase-like NADH-dependent reductase (Old Yellow Enzyme family)